MHRAQRIACGGMDVHYNFSSVSWCDGSGRRVERERLEHADREVLRRQIADWPQDVPVVMEASFGWGWLSDELEAAGIDVHLSNCLKVEQMRQARGGVKTNQKDADLLAQLPLEPTRWWEVWRAPPEVRDRREWMRYRSDLVRVQTETKNRIHALCHRHGVYYPMARLFGGEGRRFLHVLAADGRHAGGALPSGALATLQGLLRLLDHLRAELATVARCLKGMLARDPVTRRLDGIPGLGLILAHTLQAEIGEIERFRSHKHLASYACLAPKASDTGEPRPGETPKGRRLGRRGNRVLKWAFIEAAHGAVRHGGRWRALWDRVTDGGKRDKNRGYIKVARELVKVVYVVWSREVDYCEDPPPRPGRPKGRRRRRRSTSRPGTGQPSAALVHAATPSA